MKLFRLAAIAALLAAPGAAFAQDLYSDDVGPIQGLRADRDLCSEVLEVSCREARKAPAGEAPKDGFLTRFSNLAGMFMGRVDAAQRGDWRFRITLDLKTPPSSTDNHINLDNRAG